MTRSGNTSAARAARMLATASYIGKGIVPGQGGGGQPVFPAIAFEPETEALVAAWTAKGANVSYARRYQADRLFKKWKTKPGLLAACKSLAIFVHGVAAYDTVNWASPGTRNPSIVGAPTINPRDGYRAASASTYIDSGVPASEIDPNSHAMLAWTNQTTYGSSDMGAIDAASAGYGINTAQTSSSMQFRSASANQSVSNAAFGGDDNMTMINRVDAANVDVYRGSAKKVTVAVAAGAVGAAGNIRYLGLNTTAGGAASLRKQYCGAIFSRALTADEIKVVYDSIRTYLDSARFGEINVIPAGRGEAVVDKQHIVYGATASGIAYAIECARRGKSVAIIAGWREKTMTAIGGMSANGLGWVDFYATTAWGGLARDLITSAQARSGLSFNAPMVPRDFNREVRSRLEALGITIYYGDGIDSVTVANKKITSIKTKDGRVVTGKYWHDATYALELLVAAGCSYILGREAAGTGKESQNGYRGPLGTVSQPGATIDPYVIPGNASSGLIPGVIPNPGITVGSPDLTAAQGMNFRMTLSNNPNNSYPLPTTPPANYAAANYEGLGRAFAAGIYPTISDLFTIQVTGSVRDFNNKGAFSLDYFSNNAPFRYYQALIARDYAAAEAIRKEFVDYTLGLFYYIQYENDARIPTGVRTSMLNYGFAMDHYFDQNDNDLSWYLPGQVYEREGPRLVGDFILNANDHDGVDGTAPRSTNTAGAIDYPMDAHPFRKIVDTSTGTPRVRTEGAIDDRTYGGTDFISPVPFEALFPKASELVNASASFGISATHVVFCASRMELPAMQFAQSSAVAACYDLDNGEIGLQAQIAANYPAIRTALLASADPTPPVLPQVN